jgi:hypothetical protein
MLVDYTIILGYVISLKMILNSPKLYEFMMKLTSLARACCGLLLLACIIAAARQLVSATSAALCEAFDCPGKQMAHDDECALY